MYETRAVASYSGPHRREVPLKLSNASFGARVRAHRALVGQKQREAAGQIGIATGTLGAIEREVNPSVISVSQCMSIAEWMGEDLETVVRWVAEDVRRILQEKADGQEE